MTDQSLSHTELIRFWELDFNNDDRRGVLIDAQ